MRTAFEDFVREQNEIYGKFRRLAEKAKHEGIKHDPFMDIQSFLISLIHGEQVTEQVASFSERLRGVVPAVIQPQDTYHTTISNYGVEQLNNGIYDKDTADTLCGIANRIQINGRVEIDFPGWLYNQTTLIVEGHPNEPFSSLAGQINSYGGEVGIELKLPWGGHITIARFLERKRPEEITDFFRLMKEAPRIGLSKPTHIKVGYQKLNSEGFSYDTIELFRLK